MLSLWSRNPEFRTPQVGDSYVDANQYIPGMNFARFGFRNLKFTADYAVGPEEYHPFYYTHFPPLSDIINGVYHRLGLSRVPAQRLPGILWTLIGFFFFYKLIKALAGDAVALAGLLVTVSNPYLLYWGDSLFSSHQWMFVFAGLYFLVSDIRRPSGLSRGLGWAGFFCAAFSNYELIPFMVLFAAGVKILKLEELSLRKLLFFLSAPAAAFLLRNVLIIWALGFEFWHRDLAAIFLKRSYGLSSTFADIYDKFPVVIWDRSPEVPEGYLLLLYRRLENLYGYGWSAAAVLLLFKSIRKRVASACGSPGIIRLAALFLIMGSAWFFIFPQHTATHFAGSTPLLFFPFSGLLWGIFIVGIWRGAGNLKLRLGGVMLILAALSIGRLINHVPHRPFPGIESLPAFEGKVFSTNAIPSLVQYYTEAPAAYCNTKKRFSGFLEGDHYFLLRDDRIPHPEPEYFFSVDGFKSRELSDSFTLVESGVRYEIFRLREPSGGGKDGGQDEE